jgi:dihydrofolate synthase / folylpolyglutamate synthase
MQYDEMLDYLYGLGKLGSILGLERIEKVSKELGNPHKNLKVIHIAGTNGKGSVATMLDSILREAGYSVGLYTSPHLVDFRERIRVNGEMISKDDCLKFFAKLKDKDLTFFEYTTMLAFLHFSEKKPDFVILEVGCGGEFDATNICIPFVSIITKIALDHQEFLGAYNVKDIAKTKCGIIKQAPVFTCNSGDILEVVKEKCKQQEVNLVVTGDYLGEIGLKGEFQKQNAGIAVSVAKFLGVDDNIICDGIVNTKWFGRIDWLEKNVLIDGAHNEDGVEALVEYLKGLEYDKLILVFGACDNKNYIEFLKMIPYDKLILTKADLARAVDPEVVKKKIGEAEIVIDSLDALNKAKKLAGENDLILVTGSLYLLGDLMKKLMGREDRVINEFV